MKLMIVEDEEHIREGLSELINWKQEGFDTPIIFPSAVDALQFLSIERVDLIITDIFMPVLSGLEFIKMVKELYADISFIILSGHERFELAQEALELGVKKYLLKPISQDKLLKAVRDVCHEIEEKMKISDWIAVANQKLTEYLPVIQNQFWNYVIEGKTQNLKVIEKMAATAEISLNYNQFTCLAVRVMKKDESDLSLTTKVAIQQIILGFIDNVIYSMSAENTELVIISSNVTDNQLELLKKSLNQNLGLTVCFGIGRAYEQINLIYKSANEASEAVMSIRNMDDTFLVRYDDIAHWKKNNRDFPYILEKEIIDMIRFHEDLDKNIWNEFIDLIFPPKYLLEETKIMLIQFVTELYRIANEYSINLPDFKETINAIDSFVRVEDYIVNAIDIFMCEKRISHQRFVSIMVDQIKDIINKNFHNAELSISFLADKVNVTPNYLSRIFKAEVGQTCIDYITQVRMEAAKEMLINTNTKSYLIAYETGYNNPNYFSAVFKKYTGKSPREFREKG